MKKGRPAITLSALAAREDAERVASAIFENTTTFGIRRCSMSRYCLPRRHEEVETAFGTIRVKVAEGPAGAQTVAPEYEDCLKAAEQAGVPLKTVYAAALKAFGETGPVRSRKRRVVKRRAGK